MAAVNLEHTNLTVEDPHKLANLLCSLFDWKIRWSGPSLDNGFTVHVGGENNYLALYSHTKAKPIAHSHLSIGTVNHIGFVVDDLMKMEKNVVESGFKTMNHRDYGVCKSFYFMAEEALEIEVVSYSQ